MVGAHVRHETHELDPPQSTFGRQLTEATNGEALTSSYDAASNRTGLTWPDGNAATYAYDPLDRMSSAAMGGVSTTIGYDNLSRRTSMNRSTGAATS